MWGCRCRVVGRHADTSVAESLGTGGGGRVWLPVIPAAITHPGRGHAGWAQLCGGTPRPPAPAPLIGNLPFIRPNRLISDNPGLINLCLLTS